MSSPTLSPEEVHLFLEAAQRSHTEAIEIMVKYDFVNQLLLQDYLDYIEKGN